VHCQHWPAGILIFLMCARMLSFAQEVYHGGDFVPIPADTTPRINTASILFDRNLNTYNWVGRAAIDTVVRGVRVGFLQQYAANIIEFQAVPAGSPPKLQSSQQSLSLLVGAPVSEIFVPQVRWSSFVYSDNKGTGLNNASSYSLLGGMEYSPFLGISVTPLAGYRWDTQAGIGDRGATYGVGARAPGFDTDGYLISGVAQYRQDYLNPRRLEGDFAHITVEKQFTSFTRDSLDLGLNRNRHEFYQPADSNIESRIEQVFSLANKLDYELDPALSTTVFVSVMGRGLDNNLKNWNATVPSDLQFDTHIDEFRFDTYLQTAYHAIGSRAGAWMRLNYSERTESHTAKLPASPTADEEARYLESNAQEGIKDNTSRRTILSGYLDLPMTLSDRLSMSGSVGILRYDTPSDLNVEDRDELLIALGLSTTHQISRTLALELSLDGTLNHLVYLLKERSANNNINRILRFSPRTIFRPMSGFTTLNGFEVLANYTVYDFEQELPAVKSFAYRQVGWVDSTSIDFTSRIGCDLFTYLRVYQQGELQWSAFREREESAATEQTYSVQVRVSPARSTLFAVGIRYFGQWHYTYSNGDRALDSFLSSVGPTCTILWDPGAHTRIQFQGWYERRRETDGSVLSLASMDLNLYVNL